MDFADRAVDSRRVGEVAVPDIGIPGKPSHGDFTHQTAGNRGDTAIALEGMDFEGVLVGNITMEG